MSKKKLFSQKSKKSKTDKSDLNITSSSLSISSKNTPEPEPCLSEPASQPQSTFSGGAQSSTSSEKISPRTGLPIRKYKKRSDIAQTATLSGMDAGAGPSVTNPVIAAPLPAQKLLTNEEALFGVKLPFMLLSNWLKDETLLIQPSEREQALVVADRLNEVLSKRCAHWFNAEYADISMLALGFGSLAAAKLAPRFMKKENTNDDSQMP